MALLSKLAQRAHTLPPSVTKVRVGRIAAFFFAKLGVRPVVPITLRDGTTMILDARSRNQGGPVWNGSFEVDTLEILKACLPAGGCLLDVGANVGLIAVPMARWLAKTGGSVIAVEPVAANRARLTECAAANDLSLRTFEVALGDTEGVIGMHRETGLGAATGNAIMGDVGSAFYADATIARLTRFSSLRQAEGIGRVDVVKIDVEGAELHFIRGGLELFASDRAVVFGEFNAVLMPLFGHSFLDVDAIVGPLGYRYVAFESSGHPVEVKAHIGLGNALLVPDERFDEVMEALKARQHG